MYYLDGIVYRIIYVGGIILLIGLLVLAISRFWIPQKANKPTRNIAVFIIIVSIIYICFHIYKLCNPKIVCHEGYLTREYRDSAVGPFTHAYVFTNGDGLKQTYYIDVFSKKDMIASDLDTQTLYRVYYEADLRIIVFIEIVNE